MAAAGVREPSVLPHDATVAGAEVAEEGTAHGAPEMALLVAM